MNNFEEFLVNRLLEGLTTGDDPEATSRRVHKFDRKIKRKQDQDWADDRSAGERRRRIRAYDKQSPEEQEKDVAGDPRLHVQLGQRPQHIRDKEKSSDERGEQMERIRQRVVARSGGKADPSDPHDSVSKTRHDAKLKWGEGYWAAKGKRKGEGEHEGRRTKSGEEKVAPIGSGDRRGREETTGGRRSRSGRGLESGDRRDPEMHPTRTKWKRL